MCWVQPSLPIPSFFSQSSSLVVNLDFHVSSSNGYGRSMSRRCRLLGKARHTYEFEDHQRQ